MTSVNPEVLKQAEYMSLWRKMRAWLIERGLRCVDAETVSSTAVREYRRLYRAGRRADADNIFTETMADMYAQSHARGLN